MWNNLSLNKKVISAFVLVSVLVGVTSWIAMSGINRLSDFIEHTLTDQIHHGELANSMEQHLLKSQDATSEYLSTGNVKDLVQLRRDFNAELATFGKVIDESKGTALDAMETALIDEISVLKQQFARSTGKMMDGHTDAVKARAEVSDLLVRLTETTPKILAAMAFAQVAPKDQTLVTEQILALFNYTVTRSASERAAFDDLGEQVSRVKGYDAIAPIYEEYISVAHQVMVGMAREDTSSKAARTAMESLDTASSALQVRTEKLLAQQRREISSAQNEAANIRTTTGRMMTVMSVVAVALSLLIGGLVSRIIVGPLVQAIEHLKDGSTQVEQSSLQISRASMQQAEGASEQAASIEETSATMTDMTQKIEQNAKDALSATTLAVETRDAATAGNETMGEMAEAMRAIHASSSEIAKVINVIDDIAFQTNILSLNAAVEAARAGEAGMGFAVVADEVRNLAQRSADAAKNTSAMISESISRATRGVEIMEDAGQALAQITDRAVEMSGLVERIAEASSEQSSDINQVTLAMQQMEEVTQQAASSAEHSASSSEELNSQVGGLRDLVGSLDQLLWGQGGAPENTPEDGDDADSGPSTRILSPLNGDRPRPEDMDLF